MQRKKVPKFFSQMAVKTGDESHGIESVKNHLKNKSKPPDGWVHVVESHEISIFIAGIHLLKKGVFWKGYL